MVIFFIMLVSMVVLGLASPAGNKMFLLWHGNVVFLSWPGNSAVGWEGALWFMLVSMVVLGLVPPGDAGVACSSLDGASTSGCMLLVVMMVGTPCLQLSLASSFPVKFPSPGSSHGSFPVCFWATVVGGRLWVSLLDSNIMAAWSHSSSSCFAFILAVWLFLAEAFPFLQLPHLLHELVLLPLQVFFLPLSYLLEPFLSLKYLLCCYQLLLYFSLIITGILSWHFCQLHNLCWHFCHSCPLLSWSVVDVPGS